MPTSFPEKLLREMETFIKSSNGYLSHSFCPVCSPMQIPIELPIKTVWIKIRPSFLPIVDSSLKRISKKHGGWARIVAPDFEPGEQLLSEFSSAGCIEQFMSARRFYDAHPQLLKPFTEDLVANRSRTPGDA
jgi:hypothetical protein